ncbi:MAG: 23S rRNA (pseudouridine(1915)-N(3))-methyltransferase RlmH [Clostridia bacterium]|nr:23S rRNA (pseudouridine(1915)-N(3))-methyltransferase RlmH [Clostridia bacterium]
MNIKIICVGDFKEKYLKEMNDEYLKRLSKYCKLETIVLKDERLPENLNETNINIIKDKEALSISNKLQTMNNPYIIALDEHGKEYTSLELAKKMESLPTMGYSTICYIIGGSLGLHESIRKKSHEMVSFSKLTFPHQLIRVFLEEQLFRCFKINNNESYHH